MEILSALIFFNVKTTSFVLVCFKGLIISFEMKHKCEILPFPSSPLYSELMLSSADWMYTIVLSLLRRLHVRWRLRERKYTEKAATVADIMPIHT